MATANTEILKILKGLGTEKEEFTFLSTRDAIAETITDYIKKWQDNLKKEKHNASNKLSQSIGEGLKIKVLGTKFNISFSLEDYWENTDKGEKAKGFTLDKRKKLQSSILKWLVAKEGIGESNRDKIKSMSYAISTNILKKGTLARFKGGGKGTKWFSREIDNFERDLSNKVSQALGKDVDIVLKEL